MEPMGTADHDRAVELLKELGMKTYQAECFAALNTIPSGTAREISEVADVPRTRVYDATEALAEQGFIEVQHTNPQRFRAIPLAEAVRTLREQYERRIERLHETLQELELDAADREMEAPEVWTVSAEESLDARVAENVLGAEEEVVIVVAAERGWTPELETAVQTVVDRGIEVVVVTVPSVSIDVDHLDGVECFESELPWLETQADEGTICRLLLVDRDGMLLTSLNDRRDEEGEHGIVADGETNCAVVLCRRMLLDELPCSPPAS